MAVSEPNNLGSKHSGAPEGRGCLRRQTWLKNGLPDRAVTRQEQEY